MSESSLSENLRQRGLRLHDGDSPLEIESPSYEQLPVDGVEGTVWFRFRHAELFPTVEIGSHETMDSHTSGVILEGARLESTTGETGFGTRQVIVDLIQKRVFNPPTGSSTETWAEAKEIDQGGRGAVYEVVAASREGNEIIYEARCAVKLPKNAKYHAEIMRETVVLQEISDAVVAMQMEHMREDIDRLLAESAGRDRELFLVQHYPEQITPIAEQRFGPLQRGFEGVLLKRLIQDYGRGDDVNVEELVRQSTEAALRSNASIVPNVYTTEQGCPAMELVGDIDGEQFAKHPGGITKQQNIVLFWHELRAAIQLNAAGYIHRDHKSQNMRWGIVEQKDGTNEKRVIRPTIIDVGTAINPTTHSGEISDISTPMYSPPEVCAHRHGDINTSTDAYGIANMFYLRSCPDGNTLNTDISVVDTPAMVSSAVVDLDFENDVKVKVQDLGLEDEHLETLLINMFHPDTGKRWNARQAERYLWEQGIITQDMIDEQMPGLVAIIEEHAEERLEPHPDVWHDEPEMEEGETTESWSTYASRAYAGMQRTLSAIRRLIS